MTCSRAEPSDRWGEFGIGLLPPDKHVHDALATQDFLYGVLELESERESYRVIGSLVGHLFAPETTAGVLERLSSPDCLIVSLTVTEGGYFLEDGTGRFLSEHPDVQHDLAHPDSPRTWLGFVAEAAQRRMQLGHAPFTLLSCDNVQSNGATARKALLAFADGRARNCAAGLKATSRFPTAWSIASLRRPRRQDREVLQGSSAYTTCRRLFARAFGNGCSKTISRLDVPEWELAGAQITTDVAPYEETKMRLLNGGHSSIGYAADLLGYSYIAEALDDPLLKQLLIKFMAEVRQTLKQLPGIDLDSYSATIVKRFSNPTIRDQVSRICSNGCAKMAQLHSAFARGPAQGRHSSADDPSCTRLLAALCCHPRSRDSLNHRRPRDRIAAALPRFRWIGRGARSIHTHALRRVGGCSSEHR